MKWDMMLHLDMSACLKCAAMLAIDVSMLNCNDQHIKMQQLTTQKCFSGNDQKSGTSAAPQQQSAPPASAAPQAEVTGPSASALSPTASSASLRLPTTQVPGPGTGAGAQYGNSGMPLGAVDMSRAGEPAAALGDDNGRSNTSVQPVTHDHLESHQASSSSLSAEVVGCTAAIERLRPDGLWLGMLLPDPPNS